jgi:uncharacterized protein (TIGR02594 family)
MKIIEVQQALAQKGYKPGALDGVWGRQTASALRSFQADHHLQADGILGPLTLAALFPDSKQSRKLDDPSLIWFKEALLLLGTRETPGAGSNPTILDWATDQGIPYKGDDIPWCGLFVGHCISSTLDRESTPTRVLSARAWGSFGIKTKPTPGAVMVFWRQSTDSGFGHVGFYAGEDDKAYRIVGGNQSDSVSLAWIAKDRLVDARWPSSVSAPIPAPLQIARTDQLSWNEA